MVSRKKKVEPVSNWWYLVPIFFGLLGSIITWFALKERNRNKAKEIAIVGFFLGIVIWVFLLLFLGLFFFLYVASYALIS